MSREPRSRNLLFQLWVARRATISILVPTEGLNEQKLLSGRKRGKQRDPRDLDLYPIEPLPEPC
jgi:hypothetical protein